MASRARKATPWRMYAKMGIGGAILAIGGPLFTMWLTPTEEELFLRYNPELQKRSLENRQQKQQDFDDFVTRLKVYSKSDKPIWEAGVEYEENKKKELEAATKKEKGEIAPEMKLAGEIGAKKEKLRKEAGPLVPGGSL